MDLSWEGLETIRHQQQQQQQNQLNRQQKQRLNQSKGQPQLQEDNEAWESNSSDDTSVGDYEGVDMMMMPQNDVDIDEDLSYDFPRDELAVLLDGLNKWPWTVYPVQLTNCLASAAKIVSMNMEGATAEIRRLQTLYREATPSAFEKCLDDKAIWKWSDEIHNNIFDAICRLMDLVVVKLPQVHQDDVSTMDDLLPLLRALALALDKQSQYHIKHKEQTRTSGVTVPGSVLGIGLASSSKFARPLPGSPTAKKNGDWYCSVRKASVRDSEGCECSRCRPMEFYSWLSYLLNYFGQTAYGNGYQQLIRILSVPHKLVPAVLEAVLLIVSRAIEFLNDDIIEAFSEPCNGVLKYVAERLESDVDSLSDKTRDGSFAALSSILKHLQIVIACNTSLERAENVVSVVQRRLVERMLGFHSFNKQLSAVREINKLLENARSLASRDNSQSVSTTIQWLEKMDILKKVLRSHLHHKQYVDQVQKIMRFLLQEKCLSEEHLDAIWAATEKPDQFEAVKANIFDLIADLAWSFSPEQLDNLFSRFERSQGQSASDTLKILTLVKKLARSDNKGVMATRLLELLWKMMLSDEATGEIMESGAFTEILGHYDSINCASKDVYIYRCLENITGEKAVIPSLRLLRDFIWLDNEKPFYQDDISRQMRLQQLIKDHDLLNMVVGSLEKYMFKARTSSPHNTSDDRLSNMDSPLYSHNEQVKERLEFLLFVLQSSGLSLSWETAERLWNCLIETPSCETDKESGFNWFFESLDKWCLLTMEAQTNILTLKITLLDPSSLSLAAWRCFLRLFLWVNQSKEKLKPTQTEDGLVVHDLDLVGLPYLWEVAFHSSEEPIIDQSVNYLREIHSSLSEALQEDVSGIRQRFINKCMEFLETCIGGDKLGISNESRAGPASGTTSGEIEKIDSTLSKVPLMNSVTPLLCRQIQNCLRVLRTFIIKCEGRCSRTIPPHTASFQGRPFKLGVNTPNKQSSRFDVAVHTNEYLGLLRAKVAKLLDYPVVRVRLAYLNRELSQDSQVLWQCGLIGGQTITASLNLAERVTKPCDEQHLPGILISKNTKFYDALFRLSSSSDSNIREGANNILALLPTHPAILEDFQNLGKKDPQEAQFLLESHFQAHSRLLYTLQVLDGLVMPVNRPIDADTLQFRKAFLEGGGVKYLLNVLEPGALSESVDNQTRRGCYASCLRLLKFLLSEKMAIDDERVSAANNNIDIQRVDMGEGTKVQMTTMSDDSQVSLQDESYFVDMVPIVFALRRITMVSALGQLSAMGSSSPVLPVPGKPKGKSAKKRSFPDDVESGLDPEDQYLCFEAFNFLMVCLLRHKHLWRSFFTSPETDSFIVAMVLHSPDKSVRYHAAVEFLKLRDIRLGHERIAYRRILAALLGAKNESSLHPKRCLHFWELLGQLFYYIEGSEEREMAEKQLDDEIQWLESAPAAVDDDDKLLEGRLHYIKTLVEVLDARIIGASKAQKGRGLVQLLVKNFLFPDSVILLHDDSNTNAANQIQQVRFGVFGVTPEEDGLLQSKCGTRGSREKAFQLLLCLSIHCKESFQEVAELIFKIHLSEQVLDWEHLPSYGRKAIGGYVGLKNAGATCYMNSVFQQLFMQPEVRRSVLACTECDDVEKPGSVFFQLQAMFGALLGSSLDHYTPQGFWCAYRDYDGMPINLREHQDAFEFFNRLYDAIDETLKATHQETTLTRIFGGVFAQQVICRGCPHRSEREEPFAAISVDVKNKKDLMESLEAFVRGDLLEGDNAYHCEECGTKVDALKRVCVKLLPHTLVVHLKRFDFDYETMQRLKLKDRFEFPIKLDMKPYTVEGLSLRESQNLSPRGNNNTMDATKKVENISHQFKPDPYYQYDLVGVVVHSGTAFAGHYYSYIKQRPGDHPLNCGPNQKGGWIAFDDKNVEPYDVNDLEKDCFGGKYTVDVYDNFLKTTAPQEFDRPNSAYMLLYERSQPEVSSTDSSGHMEASHLKEDDMGDEPMKEIAQSQRLPSQKTVQMPASVHRSVWQENLRFIHETHLMDKDYFRFLFKLVEINFDLVEANSSGDFQKAALIGSNNPASNTKISNVLVDDFAKIMITLSTEFLLRVYFRMHASLREDMSLWKSLMCKLFEKSAIACQKFIQALIDQQQWILDYLIRCPVEEIQQVFATVLVKALKCAVFFLNGDTIYNDAKGCSNDVLQIYALIDVLLSFLRDPTLPKYSCHQYFQVLLEYANLGAHQRFHMLRKSVLNQLVATTVNFASKVNYQMAKLDFACLHSLVSLLLRTCDTSQLQMHLNSRHEGEGSTDVTEPHGSNPLQLTPTFPIPKEAVDAVFKQRVYISVLIETFQEHEEAVKLLEFCSWNNESFTMWVLQDLLEALHRAVNGEVKPLLDIMLRMLMLEDSLQKVRQKILLLGHDNFRAGVMTLIVTRVMNTQKRYLLMKFVVKLVNACPVTKAHLVGKRADWKRVVDWLQEEIQSHGAGPNSGSSSTASNEDSCNGHLQRTNSAEWTLVNSRNLFTS